MRALVKTLIEMSMLRKASLLALLLISVSSSAQQSRALLIGIGQYIQKGEMEDPRPIWLESVNNLKSPANDLVLVSSMLTTQMGFTSDHITVLRDKDATRLGIYDALQKSLAESSTGDVFFFYYSGHGSHVKNTLSPEADQSDEAIVPADGIYKGSFIRDKELAKILQQFIDKGVIVTVIIDSCHSGSIARDAQTEVKAIEAPDGDMYDPYVYPQPESQGALIISATQDFQVASGSKESDNRWYSNFTKTLVEVSNSTSPNIPVQQFFDAVAAKMKYKGYAQMPVIAGNEERRKAGLLGKPVSSSTPLFASIKVDEQQKVHMMAGPASGIKEGSVFKNVKLGIELEVIEITGMNESACKVKRGDYHKIKSGTLFECSKRSLAVEKEKLRVFIPEFPWNKDSLNSQVARLYPPNTCADTPRETFVYEDNLWYREIANGERLLVPPAGMPKTINAEVEAPLYQSLFKELNNLLADEYGCVEISTKEQADFWVVGDYINGELCYHLARNKGRLDGDDPYPATTDFIKASEHTDKELAKFLATQAYKINRMKGWLTLESTSNFPYKLMVRKNNEKEYMRDGNVKLGDRVHIYLNKNTELDSIERRFVYVFGISSDGSIQLILPFGGSNVENFLPINKDDTIEVMAGGVPIGPPYGTDHLILLATKEPIVNPRVIEQTGVLTRSVSANSIDDLITGMNMTGRAAGKMKSEFYIDRISLTSSEK